MKAADEQFKEPATLVLKGDWTVERAEELKALLLEALAGSEELILDPGQLTAMDISCLQVLCSAHRSSINGNKRILLKSDESTVIKRAIHLAGFDHMQGCDRDLVEGCLWKGDQ